MSVEYLDEDLQIVRATLATLGPEFRRRSPEAGRAVERALEQLEVAQSEFARRAFCVAEDRESSIC